MIARLALTLLLLFIVPFSPAADARLAGHWWEAGPALPDLTGRVVDGARLLPRRARQGLTARLDDFERRTGHQLVIVTVNSLDGQSIERFGVRLGRSWGIGRHGKDDGILLIVAPIEHLVRIEVGYGLEKALDDASCARIIARQIIPAFRTGDFPGGILAGVETIIARLSPPPVISP